MDKNSSLLNPVNELNTDGPKISIFMPTHRREPDNRQDAIAFKNLLKELEEKLKGLPEHSFKETMTALYDLQRETTFWNNSKDGLGILATKDKIQKFELAYSVAPSVKVGDSFHILPLLKYFEGANEAYIADLSRNRFKLFLFDGVMAVPVKPEGLKEDFTDLFNDFDPDANKSRSFNSLVGSYHGGPSKAEEIQRDREKYFRYLDSGFDQLRKDNPIPIILAGTSDNIRAFRDFAKGDFYITEAIEQPLDSLSPNEINQQAFAVLDNQRKVREKDLKDSVAVSLRANLAETDPAKIKKLAEEGRIAELLVNDRYIGEDSTELDELIHDLYATGAKIRSLNNEDDDRKEPYLAILRY
ncbi:MAG: hypothetical protein WAV55_12770 [Clostridiaceae bacterium]